MKLSTKMILAPLVILGIYVIGAVITILISPFPWGFAIVALFAILYFAPISWWFWIPVIITEIGIIIYHKLGS